VHLSPHVAATFLSLDLQDRSHAASTWDVTGAQATRVFCQRVCPRVDAVGTVSTTCLSSTGAVLLSSLQGMMQQQPSARFKWQIHSAS
jgi:hypothetical protein